ncbi:MAG: TlpA family protein disulfide reductase [Candidatus Eremiobacteraeota bacterium]|nr:TlpA family protein disulfide reductase [Candidatus Eremiobacteraeota bacterium]
MRVNEAARAPARIALRIADTLAIVAIAFAVWKIFVAPRSFFAAQAYPAPAAAFDRLDGTAFRLAQHRGQTVFLDFFATWCAPCNIELPLVESWAARNPRAVVLAVDVGERRPVVEDYARRLHLRNVALDPGNRARALFNVIGLPTIVAVDRRGFVRAKWEGLNPQIALAMANAQAKL